MKIKFNKVQGATLLEILIALIILSMGLLALAKSQLRSFQYNNAQYFHNLAVNQVINLAEIIRAYHATSQLEQRISDWQQESEHALPQGVASIKQQQGYYQIQLAWREDSISLASCNQPGYENYTCVTFAIQTSL